MININLIASIVCLVISIVACIRGDIIHCEHYLILGMIWQVLFKLDNMRK